jgi:hypothetical protein
MIGLAVVVFAVLVCYLIGALRKKAAPRARIRIKAMPPGEPPEWVRSAWVGLELPLIAGQVRPEGGTVHQAVSFREVSLTGGYAVDGKTAVKILQSANTEAAQWWRDNAPEVLYPGNQMVFPADVCERLDDLGGDATRKPRTWWRELSECKRGG